MFNATIPAPNGEVSNGVWCTIHNDLDAELTKKWMYNDAPLPDVVFGCPDKCKAKLVAPAVAITSCSSHQLQFDPSLNVVPNLKTIAAALAQQQFFISNALVLEDGIEKINLVSPMR